MNLILKALVDKTETFGKIMEEDNMTNTKHTPGPWKWVKARTMAHLHGPNGYFGISMSLKSLSEKDKANYELIAAAPDLLEFCEKVSRSVCLKQFSGDRCICFACEAGRLISKAEGGK